MKPLCERAAWCLASVVPGSGLGGAVGVFIGAASLIPHLPFTSTFRLFDKDWSVLGGRDTDAGRARVTNADSAFRGTVALAVVRSSGR